MFFGGQLRGSYEVRLDLVSSHFRHSPEQIRALYTQVLRRKGHWMEMLGASQTSQLGTRYPHLKDKLARMLQLGRQISGKAFTGPGLEGLKMYQRFLSAWQQEREQLEEELAHDIPEIATERKLRKVQTEDLVQTLPQDSVLVEIVHYRRAGVNPTAHYAAFVIDAEKSDPATLIDLGAADEIDKLVAAYRTALTSTQRSAKTVEVIRKAGEKLRRAVWDTIAPGVKDARRVVLALEGELSHVPFETLPTAGDEYLIDRFQFQYVTSGRDLLRDEPSLTNPGKPIVIERDEEHLGGPQQSLWRRFLNWLGILDDQQSQPEDLQSDRRSVAEQVAELLQGEHWKDQGASKTRLSKVESPKWLHLAVPCVFQGNGLNALKRTKPTSSDNSPPPTMKNLMSSSGVVLAGTGVDGRSIVTYQDIESLDLRQTDLTVLPCCDTSSKDTCSGDHVLALQNAFRQAGTKALVMTLWQVSDSTAEAIALSLYRDVLNGRPPAQALREAQLASKALGIDVRDWGAWICQVGNGAV
ncbi:MAG: CHAT domain-containing protein [Gemmataceae bacterium]